MPPPSASSQLSINDDLTISSRLNTTALHNSVSLRFKVRRKYLIVEIHISFYLRKNANVNSNQIQFHFVHLKKLLAIIFNEKNVFLYHVYHLYQNY
jgi:hypothetical protein